MDRQQEIENMAKAIPSNIIAYDRNPLGQRLYIEQREFIATALNNAGYGNVKQAVREFAERLKTKITINNTDDGYLDEQIDYKCLIEDIDCLLHLTLSDLRNKRIKEM